MIQKIINWFSRFKKQPSQSDEKSDILNDSNNRLILEQVEKAYDLGYTDGRRDGLAIAREQATKSLKEILQWQNQKNQK